MGRGDKKTAKGKRSKGSFGVSRNKTAIKSRLKRSTIKKVETDTVAAEAPAKAKKTATKKQA